MVLKSSEIKIWAGSACLWAWLDALFMSAFFPASSSTSLMAEGASILVFGLSAVGFLVALLVPQKFNEALRGRGLPWLGGMGGTLGALAFVGASVTGSYGLLLVGGVLASLFMAVFQLGWGAVYCHDGAKSAARFVAGGFAGAVIIDIPLLFMFPLAAALFYALLPLVSCLVFCSLDPEQRSYETALPYAPSSDRAARSPFLTSWLGVGVSLFCVAGLVLFSFGYLQHLVSFSSVASGGTPGGVVVQFVRGFAAIALFAVVCLAPRKANVAYRVGLLAMIAGFMLMSFLFGTGQFWIAGAVVIAGYTTFDLLLWVLFAQIAHARSHSALQTIAATRLLAVVCYVVGAVAGIVLVGNDGVRHGFVLQETNLMGYLVVIATVVLLSSKDMWLLSGMSVAEPVSEEAKEQRLAAWWEEKGLTPREREIALLLVGGRTQPWIAESLCISENTVGTHVRHIYQKLEVHDRQQFLDLASEEVKAPSPESRDVVISVTEDN
ncbi:LuxR C-terminal-related transcriptional regulator [Adlercreutzia equolifaciens]|uniref:helix-turn-helix transcriptional regulator n=1 Tax=Adlercreutzia equolifaciens TaxID=446660 RepID=UPI0023B1D6B1|nr:LuxR C-terminal-related transcriptional regulator [Adlercreutzia equolifaciens]MDE8701534.1 LuxR C-terminal-related transcriptional regulator [Adlercreutzia equolifaciens]